MNFDTRYLIRWGVPGWIFIVTIGLYFYLLQYAEDGKSLEDFVNKAPELLATAAFLVIVGIPVGYILNQIHHVWIWVYRVNWEVYFKMELEINEKIAGSGSRENELRDRYQYLLNRVHELGGLVFALLPAFFFLLTYHIVNNHKFNLLFVMYFVLLLIVSIVISSSRNYYRRNIDALTRYLIDKEYGDLLNSKFMYIRKLRKKYIKKYLKI